MKHRFLSARTLGVLAAAAALDQVERGVGQTLLADRHAGLALAVVLAVLVHGHDPVAVGRHDARHRGGVLPEVPGQPQQREPRLALRQAPDVILVGEIRDGETAEIALQAAETGHVVVATLHTSRPSGVEPTASTRVS